MADLVITSDNSCVAELARVCKFPLFKRFSFLPFAACCTVLRSRWCQSGVNRGTAASRSCSLVACLQSTSGTSRGTPAYSLPSTGTHTGCPRKLIGQVVVDYTQGRRIIVILEETHEGDCIHRILIARCSSAQIGRKTYSQG